MHDECGVVLSGEAGLGAGLLLGGHGQRGFVT